MTFKQFEIICIGLYGEKWKPSVCIDLGVKVGASTKNWERQGVPKWVCEKLPEIIEKRKIEVLKTEKYCEGLKSWKI